MITNAHAHKSGVIFHFFQELSKKIKELRPKMTKIASMGSCLNRIVTVTLSVLAPVKVNLSLILHLSWFSL